MKSVEQKCNALKIEKKINRLEEIKTICSLVMDKNGVSKEDADYMSKEIAIEIFEKGYVKMEDIKIEPGKTIQMLARILNEFRESKPFTIED